MGVGIEGEQQVDLSLGECHGDRTWASGSWWNREREGPRCLWSHSSRDAIYNAPWWPCSRFLTGWGQSLRTGVGWQACLGEQKGRVGFGACGGGGAYGTAMRTCRLRFGD